MVEEFRLTCTRNQREFKGLVPRRVELPLHSIREQSLPETYLAGSKGRTKKDRRMKSWVSHIDLEEFSGVNGNRKGGR